MKTEFTKLREQCGVTLDEAAARLEVSPRTAYRYESGESQPSRLVMKTLKEWADERCGEATKADFTFIDLFAGIGGLRKGFESIGGKCVFTSEWDDYSRKTYAANFSIDHEFAGDIREYSKDPSKVPNHDVLLAGFPCQPFSIAGVSKKNSMGRPHGFLCDTQGTLFFDLAQIIAHKKPAAFLLENVKNLEGHNGGQTFATIMNVLKNELGYEVNYRVISSEHWVPQRRERIFIVGFRKPSSFDFNKLDVPTVKQRLGNILDKVVDEKYTLTPKLWEYLKGYKEKHNAKGNGFGYSLFGPEDITRTLSARYYKDGSEVLVEQKGKRPRRLTPRECARLMGYEKPGQSDFRIPVSDTQAYRQFGNGVVVPVVEAVAKVMEPHIKQALAGKKPAAVKDTTTHKPTSTQAPETIAA